MTAIYVVLECFAEKLVSNLVKTIAILLGYVHMYTYKLYVYIHVYMSIIEGLRIRVV